MNSEEKPLLEGFITLVSQEVMNDAEFVQRLGDTSAKQLNYNHTLHNLFHKMHTAASCGALILIQELKRNQFLFFTEHKIKHGLFILWLQINKRLCFPGLNGKKKRKVTSLKCLYCHRCCIQ